MKSNKSILSTIINSIIMMSFIFGIVQANSIEPPSNGEFYLISSIEELNWLSESVNNGNSGLKNNGSAKLLSNLDFEHESFVPIGNKKHPYTGTFDGDYHIIKNVSINSEEYAGIFGLSNGSIKKLGLITETLSDPGPVEDRTYEGENVNGTYTVKIYTDYDKYIKACEEYSKYLKRMEAYNAEVKYLKNQGKSMEEIEKSVSKPDKVFKPYCNILGKNFVGGICGCNGGTIEECFNEGSTVAGIQNIGGICGFSRGDTGINNCYNSDYNGKQGEVLGEDDIGGICGYNTEYSLIKNSYNTCPVTKQVEENVNEGAICGYQSESYPTRTSDEVKISNCFANEEATGKSSALNDGNGEDSEIWKGAEGELPKLNGFNSGNEYIGDNKDIEDVTKQIEATFESNNGTFKFEDPDPNKSGEITTNKDVTITIKKAAIENKPDEYEYVMTVTYIDNGSDHSTTATVKTSTISELISKIPSIKVERKGYLFTGYQHEDGTNKIIKSSSIQVILNMIRKANKKEETILKETYTAQWQAKTGLPYKVELYKFDRIEEIKDFVGDLEEIKKNANDTKKTYKPKYNPYFTKTYIGSTDDKLELVIGANGETQSTSRGLKINKPKYEAKLSKTYASTKTDKAGVIVDNYLKTIDSSEEYFPYMGQESEETGTKNVDTYKNESYGYKDPKNVLEIINENVNEPQVIDSKLYIEKDGLTADDIPIFRICFIKRKKYISLYSQGIMKYSGQWKNGRNSTGDVEETESSFATGAVEQINLLSGEGTTVEGVEADDTDSSTIPFLYIDGDNITLPGPNEISRDGYIFKGWYTDANFTEPAITTITSNTFGNKADKILYAKWEKKKQAKVTGIADGGKYCDNLTIESDSVIESITLIHNNNKQTKPLGQTSYIINSDSINELCNIETGEYKVILTFKDKDDDGNYAPMEFSISFVDHTDSGALPTCVKGKVCNVCGKEFGTVDPDNHVEIKKVEATEPTVEKDGNIEHYVCTGCGKCFSDEAGKTEINPSDVIIKGGSRIIEGANSTWIKNSNESLEFKSNTSYNDDSTLNVSVDGEIIDSENYNVSDNGIELKSSYLQALSEGSHSIDIASSAGTASTNFTVTSSTNSGTDNDGNNNSTVTPSDTNNGSSDGSTTNDSTNNINSYSSSTDDTYSSDSSDSPSSPSNKVSNSANSRTGDNLFKSALILFGIIVLSVSGIMIYNKKMKK